MTAADEIVLDRTANIDADIAYLDAQQRGETTAECVKAALREYLWSVGRHECSLGEPAGRQGESGDNRSPLDKFIPAPINLGAPVKKVAGRIDLPASWLNDHFDFMPIIHEELDRYVNPWKYPDTYRWPDFDLFPRLTRVARWSLRWIKTLRREPIGEA